MTAQPELPLSSVDVQEMLPTQKALVPAWKCEQNVRRVARCLGCARAVSSGSIRPPPAGGALPRVILPPVLCLLVCADAHSIKGCSGAQGSLRTLILSDQAKS